jgi:hypothetical protein
MEARAVGARDVILETAAEISDTESLSKEEPADRGSCTSTVVVALKPKFGPTKTVYKAVETRTNYVDCGACEHVAVKTRDYLHPGPVVVYHTTVVAAEPSYKTKYACFPTDGVNERPIRPGRPGPMRPGRPNPTLPVEPAAPW